jgi:hypothetical protein
MNPIGIANPNGTIMFSTHAAELDLPNLPLAARRVNIVPALSTSSLLSIGQLCDSGCVVIIFDDTTVSFNLDNKRILAGLCQPTTGLWHLSLVQPAIPSTANALTQSPPPFLHQSYAAVQSATPAELVAFAYATFFSPALSTLKRAFDRGFSPICMGRQRVEEVSA